MATHLHNRRGQRTPTYRSWVKLRERCNNPNHKDYPHYGGRGISVCARWDSFAAFLADMGERPRGMTIDRIDNSKGYEPANCRWATQVQQMANTRQRKNTVLVHGHTISSLARLHGISYNAAWFRHKEGTLWPPPPRTKSKQRSSAG